MAKQDPSCLARLFFRPFLPFSYGWINLAYLPIGVSYVSKFYSKELTHEYHNTQKELPILLPTEKELEAFFANRKVQG